MTNARKRRKQPDIVWHQLLDVAARLCIKNGLHGLTLDAVANEAGISKGGLLHHFPSKQALLDARSQACLGELEHKETDDSISSTIVRLASDGLWMANFAGSPGSS